MRRSLTRSNAECCDAPLQGGDASLEYNVSWIAYSSVSKSLCLQIEQCGCVFGSIECVGDSLVYWDSDGLGCGISIESAMYRDGLDFVGEHWRIFRRRCPGLDYRLYIHLCARV